MRIIIMMMKGKRAQKYTESNGVEPSMKEMASGKGHADAIAYHINGQGDPGIC